MKICLTIFILLSLLGAVYGQEPRESSKLKSRFGFDVLRRPPLLHSVFVHYTGSAWQPEILTAVSIQNDALQFEKVNNAYHSRYQITLAVLDGEQTLLSESFHHEIRLPEFGATNARDKAQYQDYRLHLAEGLPAKKGAYELFLEIRDLVSQKSVTQKQPFEILPSGNALLLSQATFLICEPRPGDSLLHISPQQQQMDYNTNAIVYACFLSPDSSPAQVNLRLYRKEKENDLLKYQAYDTVQTAAGFGALLENIPLSNFPEGEYRLRLSLQQNKLQKEVEKDFSIVWFEKPTYLYKADLALRPMRYLLSEEEFKKAQGMSMRELESWLNDFWKKRDPSPNSDYNELVNEYFQRVQEANIRYNLRYKEGWETDQGRIYILYGEPAAIEDHKLATATAPYQVWRYPDSSQFIFTDKDRNGEFELIQDKEEK